MVINGPSEISNIQQQHVKNRIQEKVCKLYGNFVFEPIIPGKDNDRILDICAPELHIMQGTVKQIYDEMFKKWPGVKMWLDLIHLKQKNYHNDTFLGMTE